MKNFGKITAITTVALFLCVTTGCLLFLEVKKNLFAWKISKEQLLEIKQIISENGYKKITRDDYPYEGAYVTQYTKEIPGPVKIEKNHFHIFLSFKAEDLSSGAYRNFGFSVSAFGHDDDTEIRDEINRMEEIIYNKLVEFGGVENVEKR